MHIWLVSTGRWVDGLLAPGLWIDHPRFGRGWKISIRSIAILLRFLQVVAFAVNIYMHVPRLVLRLLLHKFFLLDIGLHWGRSCGWHEAARHLDTLLWLPPRLLVHLVAFCRLHSLTAMRPITVVVLSVFHLIIIIITVPFLLITSLIDICNLYFFQSKPGVGLLTRAVSHLPHACGHLRCLLRLLHVRVEGVVGQTPLLSERTWLIFGHLGGVVSDRWYWHVTLTVLRHGVHLLLLLMFYRFKIGKVYLGQSRWRLAVRCADWWCLRLSHVVHLSAHPDLLDRRLSLLVLVRCLHLLDRLDGVLAFVFGLLEYS